MRYLKTLAHVTYKTFTSPAYYADILKAPLWFSIKFYLIFWFLFSAATCFVIMPRVMSIINRAIVVVPDQVAALYPQDLEITVIDGQVSTNVVEPYYFPFSRLENLLKNLSDQILGLNSERVDYLFIIDTQASIDDFENLNTYALLTDTHLVYYNDQGNLEVVSLKNIDNLTINRPLVDSFINRLRPYLTYLPAFIGGSLLIGIFVFTLWSQLAYLLLFACIAWLLAQLTGLHLSFTKSFQLSLHLFIAITTVIGVIALVGLAPHFPFFRTLIMLLVYTGILIRLKELFKSA